MQTKTVYCLTGATGEREDVTTWIVRCSTNKDSIKKQLDSLLDWIHQNRISDRLNRYLEKWPESCPLDSGYQCTQSGVTYYVDEILVEID